MVAKTVFVTLQNNAYLCWLSWELRNRYHFFTKILQAKFNIFWSGNRDHPSYP